MIPPYYFLLELVGHLITFGIIAATALIAFRHTSFYGFRLILYFALGQIFLSLLNATVSAMCGHFLSGYAVGYALTVTGVLSYLLYAVGVAGVFNLWFSKDALHA
jgi:hypothetical protein